MKKINYLVKILVVIISAGIVTSCLKADNSFGFASGGGYIVQEYVDGNETPRFFTYINYTVGNGDLASGSVSKGDEIFSGNITVDNFYETAPLYKTSLSDVNGSYTLKATSTEGKTASATLTFGVDTSKKLGKMEVVDFYYTGSQFMLKIKTASNATGYGFLLRPETESSVPSYSRAFDKLIALYTSNAYESGSGITVADGVYTVALDFDSNDDMGEITSLRVYPLAVYNSDYGNIIMTTSEGKVLYKGGSSIY